MQGMMDDEKKIKHQLFSHLLPVYPCTQEHTLFLMHWPPFLQGGLHTAEVEERKALLGDLKPPTPKK